MIVDANTFTFEAYQRGIGKNGIMLVKIDIPKPIAQKDKVPRILSTQAALAIQARATLLTKFQHQPVGKRSEQMLKDILAGKTLVVRNISGHHDDETCYYGDQRNKERSI